MNIFYNCAICDCIHPWNFGGDCNDDKNRYEDYNDICERLGQECDFEIHSWKERFFADLSNIELSTWYKEHIKKDKFKRLAEIGDY